MAQYTKIEQLVSIVKTTVKTIKAGQIRATDEVMSERFSICTPCEFYSENIGRTETIVKSGFRYWILQNMPIWRLPKFIQKLFPKPKLLVEEKISPKCTKCGCKLLTKIAVQGSSCPMRKW